jgi:hypothetical protein
MHLSGYMLVLKSFILKFKKIDKSTNRQTD